MHLSSLSGRKAFFREEGGRCIWVKPGRFGRSFMPPPCVPNTLRTLSLEALFTRGGGEG